MAKRLSAASGREGRLSRTTKPCEHISMKSSGNAAAGSRKLNLGDVWDSGGSLCFDLPNHR